MQTPAFKLKICQGRNSKLNWIYNNSGVQLRQCTGRIATKYVITFVTNMLG